jgi:hypothetical protein
VPEELARQVSKAVQNLRKMDLQKRPGVAETLDWARALAQGLPEPSRRSGQAQVPELLGLSLVEAQRLGGNAGVTVLLEAEDPSSVVGLVVRQMPAPGSLVPVGSVVLVWTGEGPDPSGVRDVPT